MIGPSDHSSVGHDAVRGLPSVCRFCGAGCGIRVGMRDGAITDIRGDESAHNKGVMCVKGSMLRALPLIPGRLTTRRSVTTAASSRRGGTTR
jgi:anaerobic selenocysteine-containing dehydrogenase